MPRPNKLSEEIKKQKKGIYGEDINDSEKHEETVPESEVITQTFGINDIFVPSLISNLLQMKHHIGERSPP
jgi:hypothetical protein